MNYNKINNITGWIVCLISCAVYLMTKEATVSFWDCGEFAAGAVKLEVVHSPGAPLFLLIGRLFTIIFGEGNGALGVNILSALCSGFTILFLFWTITHFAKRIVSINKLELNNNSIIGIMAAGIVGGLAYTFSDTFWFSAVEAEVYAMSSLLTALVFWTILKWEENSDKAGSVKWIVFIAYMMGLSVGGDFDEGVGFERLGAQGVAVERLAWGCLLEDDAVVNEGVACVEATEVGADYVHGSFSLVHGFVVGVEHRLVGFDVEEVTALVKGIAFSEK